MQLWFFHCVLLHSILICLQSSRALNIMLTSPSSSKSLTIVSMKLACALEDAGHNISLALLLPNGPSTKVDPPCPMEVMDLIPSNDPVVQGAHQEFVQTWAYSPQVAIKMFGGLRIYEFLSRVTCEALATEQVFQKLDSQNLDLGIGYVYNYCPLGLMDRLGIPGLWFSPGNFILDFMDDYLQIPHPVSYVPEHFAWYGDKMDFLERVHSLLWSQFFYLWKHGPGGEHANQQRLFNGDVKRPSFQRLSEDVTAVLINGAQLLDFPRPTGYRFHYISNISPTAKTGATKTVTTNTGGMLKDLQDCIDGAAKGVVLFSFGTQANTDEMPAYMKDAFVGAFKQFPDYNIIWKVTSIFTLPDDAKNIKLMTWIAQKQLLHHPKMKLFITHGGYNSLLEACDAGVPILSIPLFLDQFGNSQRSNRLGFGLTLDKSNLTVRTVSQTMHELLQNDKYRQRARKVSAMLSDVPISNREHFVFLVERSYRHHKVINRLTKIRRINFIKFYYIDLVAGILSMCLLVAKLCVSCIVKYLRMNKAT